MVQTIQANMNMFAHLALHHLMNNLELPHTQGQPPASDDSISKLSIIHELTEKRRLKHRICSICQDDFKSAAAAHPAHQHPRDTLNNHNLDDTTEAGQDDTIIRMVKRKKRIDYLLTSNFHSRAIIFFIAIA
jgi:hypothetical protein